MNDLLWMAGVFLGILALSLMAVAWAALPILLVMWLLSHLPVPKMNLLASRRLSRLTGASVVTCVISLAWPIRPFILRSRQVKTCADMGTVRFHLEEVFQSTGHYPEMLTEVLPSERQSLINDAWGGQLFYDSHGSSYILASLGRDHRRDGSDYWALRSLGQRTDVDGDWDADQVVSDRGWLQSAGK